MTKRTLLARATLTFLCLVIGQVQSAPTATPTERLTVTAIKTLLKRAAERGEAHGILSGPGADYVRRKFDATTPIEIDVRRLHPLPQPGCGRLEVMTHQRAVRENGSRHDEKLTYELSFCSDGRFPDKR